MNIVNDDTTGVFKEGKKFIAYSQGKVVGESYNQRTAEIVLEKATGTYVEKRGRKISQSSNLIFSPPNITTELVFAPPPKIAENKFTVDERFDFLEKAVALVASKIQPSVILCGGAGVGKTTTVHNTLNEWGYTDNTLIDTSEGVVDENSYVFIKGFSTAKGLYRTLWANNGAVLVFDDCDSVFSNDTSVQILKAVLDSYSTRTVTWSADMRKSEDNLPRSFNFTGSIIFISNLNIEKIDSAITSRSLCIDLKMTKEELIDRMRTIMKSSSFLPEYSMKVKEDSLEFIDEHKENAKEISLRTLITISKIRNEYPDEWKGLSEYVMMK